MPVRVKFLLPREGKVNRLGEEPTQRDTKIYRTGGFSTTMIIPMILLMIINTLIDKQYFCKISDAPVVFSGETCAVNV
jgi:hypothetical protein